jgi:hypothetical protein
MCLGVLGNEHLDDGIDVTDKVTPVEGPRDGQSQHFPISSYAHAVKAL